MAEKPKLKYRVVAGKKPGTQIAVYRPVITERQTYYIDQVVEYALNAGYVRGQFEDMKGALNGFISAIQALGKTGVAVNLGTWLRVHAELTGSVDAAGTLTEDNALKVNITPLTELKVSKEEFTFENIDAPENIVKVSTIMTSGGTVGEVTTDADCIVTGKNLKFLSGDTVTITAGAVTQTVTVGSEGVKESDYSHLKIDAAVFGNFTSVAKGTPMIFTFNCRGGTSGAPTQTVTKAAIWNED